MSRGAWVLLFLLAGGAGATPKYPDEPVTYHFDLTREGEKKATVLTLSLPAKIWQHGDHPLGWAPGTSVRKGWGTAWFYIDDPQSPGAAAHAYLEIEELGKRRLKQAVAEAVANLDDVTKQAAHSLLSAPSAPVRVKFRIGRKSVEAHRIEYTVAPPKKHGAGVFHAKALFFAVNKQLVTLTVDDVGSNAFFELFAKGFGLSKERARSRPFPFKLFFVDAGVSRFLTLEVPSGFRRVYRSAGEPKLAAVFERPKTRFTVRESWAPKRSLAQVMEKGVPALREKHEGFEGPKEFKISGLPAFEISFRRDKAFVRRVYARIATQDYTLTWETEEDQSLAFDRVLASARMWRSRVR